MNEKNLRRRDETAPEIEAESPRELLGFKLSELSNATLRQSSQEHRGPGCPPLSLEADCTWTSLTQTLPPQWTEPPVLNTGQRDTSLLHIR